MVLCSWTMCRYCKDIKNIQGKYNHPNDPDKMVAKGDITVKKDAMIKCKQYCRKDED